MSDLSKILPDLSHEFAEVNGARIHYVKAGKGPLMLFQHGFPQCWYTFRHQLAEFAKTHTVVAPDLRGYNLSSKPTKRWEYGTWVSVEDIRALVHHLGFETYVHVGHDTGGVIGYSMALHYPTLLDGLVILCTAHPATFDRDLHEDQEQIKASQYLLFTRRLDSAGLLAGNDFERLKNITALPFFSDVDRQVYLEAWRQPGAAEGIVGWYQREGLGPRDEIGTPARGNTCPEVSPQIISVASLVVHTDDDAYVRPHAFSGMASYMPNATVTNVPGSHWICEEHPQLVNRMIRAFIDGKLLKSSETARDSNLATA
jgi:epoxide hydrolase 4